MIDVIITLGRVVGIALIALLLLVVAIKIAWNIGLAYAMVREDVGGVRRSWSAFPLIEVVPLFGAVGLSFLVRTNGWVSPWFLLLWGLVAVAGSYCHLALVLITYGFYRRRKQRLHPKA